MKSVIVFAALILGGTYAMMKPAAETPTAETLVAMPRARLWAELATPFASIQNKAEHVTTVTGTPPVPVKFTFDQNDGEMLHLTARAGFRTVDIKARLEDGPRPGETRLKLFLDPASLGTNTGDTDPRYQLRSLLEQTDEQFVEKQRITALFGPAARAR